MLMMHFYVLVYYKDLGYDKLCVSYGATWYNDCFSLIQTPDMGKALGRVDLFKELLKLKGINILNFIY